MLDLILILGAFGLGFACGRAPDETLAHLKDLSSRALNALKWW